MLLTPAQVVALCQQPAHAADLAAGRALERRCRLHVEGSEGDLLAFLEKKRPSLLSSPEAWETMKEKKSAATKALFGGFTELLDKIFTAPGGTRYFEFTDPSYSEDFQAYLSDTARAGDDFYGQFATLWKKQSLTGFQGVFLVDLPTVPDEPIPGIDGVPGGLPEPFIRYVPSGSVHDMQLTGNRIEYLALKCPTPDGPDEYYCWDDTYCHRVQSVNGLLTYVETLRTAHGLAYVPACPVTTLQPDPTRPVWRTCLLEKSLDRADDYLDDYNAVRLGNAYHANPKMWSYGLDCDYVPLLTKQQWDEGCIPVSCATGNGLVGVQGSLTRCPQCQGKRRYIPVGPDKTYIVQPAPAGETSVVNPGPAGYIAPDLSSLEYLKTSCDAGEVALEKAILGKAGLMEMLSKAESGLKALTDLSPLTGRLDTRGQDSLVAEKFLADTLARLRYGSENYQGSNITRGKHYHFFSVDTVVQAFADAKKNGADAGYLYSLLEDIIYAKYGDDPMELERNLLKLELTPAPHQTVQEAAALGFVGLQDLVQKTFLNDFINRFERENGSILEFGSALSHQQKIDRIQQQLTRYADEKSTQPLPGIVPGRATLDPAGQSGPVHAAADGAAANAGGAPGGAGAAKPAVPPAAGPAAAAA